MKKEGIDFGEALRIMAERAGVSLPSRFEPSVKRDEKERLYQINEAATQYFHNLLLNSSAGEKVRNYVANRGLSLETIINFKLGFSLNSWEALQQHLTDIGYTKDELLAAGLVIENEAGGTHDRFRQRLMFPIYDIRGRVTGFGARALDDSLPKYLNSPQTPIFDKGSSLYGINQAAQAIRAQDRAVIVEGYMDVITAHQNGFNNVIASMGTSVTEKQISTLKRLTKNIILALDADAAGEEAMLRCVGYENTLDTEMKVITLPRGKDPDDVIKEDAKNWQNLLGGALPTLDYTFNMVTSSLDLTTARDKSSVVDRLLPIIAEVRDPVRQAHYLQKLARLVNVTERHLEAALRRLKPSPSKRRGEEPRREAITQALRPLFSSPVEEYCLSLLLQHPELKNHPSPLAEYFQNSENREIFTIWQQVSDPSSLKNNLDPAMWEHLDSLITRRLPDNQIERKYADCTLNLRKKYLQGLEAKRAEIFALEVELGGTGADLVKLKEEGIETSTQLLEVFTQKRQGIKNQGDEK